MAPQHASACIDARNGGRPAPAITSGSGITEAAAAWAALSPRDRAEAFFDSLRAGAGYDRSVVDGIAVQEAARGRVVCRLRVDALHANQYGTLHGACIGTLVDVMGSAVVVTASPRCGVALAINTHFLAPGPGEGEIEVEASIARAGKQIANTIIELRTPGGANFACGTHVKALVPASDLSPVWERAAARRLLARSPTSSGGGGTENVRPPPVVRSRL